MRSPDFADGMGLTFLDEGHGRINARGVRLNGPSTSCFTFNGPRLKLMCKSRRVRPQHDTNAQANRCSHLCSHCYRVGICCTVTCFIRGWSRKIRAVHEHKVRASSTSEILGRCQASSVATQMKVVVGDGPLVGGHPQASLTKASRLSICVRQWTAAIATMLGWRASVATALPLPHKWMVKPWRSS